MIWLSVSSPEREFQVFLVPVGIRPSPLHVQLSHKILQPRSACDCCLLLKQGLAPLLSISGLWSADKMLWEVDRMCKSHVTGERCCIALTASAFSGCWLPFCLLLLLIVSWNLLFSRQWKEILSGMQALGQKSYLLQGLKLNRPMLCMEAEGAAAVACFMACRGNYQ